MQVGDLILKIDVEIVLIGVVLIGCVFIGE